MKAISTIKKNWVLYLAILVAILITIVFANKPICYAEEEEIQDPKPTSTYKALSKDYEIESLEYVKVNKTTRTVSTMCYTLSEIDFYISTYRTRIEESEKKIEELQEIRNKIEIEAKKVKLKVEDETVL